MIPVLGVPILTEPALMWEMLRSVDVEVDRLVIVDNSGEGYYIPSLPEFDRFNVTYVRPGHNMGVAASWNAIIKTTSRAEWWAIVNHDVVFSAGDLARLEEHMDSAGGLATMMGGFSIFGIDREVVARVGLFDENYVPAYFEDNDYDYRCRLAGVQMTGLPSGSTHRISSTLRSDPRFMEANKNTFLLNREYYISKWGGTPYQEMYDTPFNNGGDFRTWRLDIDRLADQSWT